VFGRKDVELRHGSNQTWRATPGLCARQCHAGI